MLTFLRENQRIKFFLQPDSLAVVEVIRPFDCKDVKDLTEFFDRIWPAAIWKYDWPLKGTQYKEIAFHFCCVHYSLHSMEVCGEIYTCAEFYWASLSNIDNLIQTYEQFASAQTPLYGW